jgi:hypothetical protein
LDNLLYKYKPCFERIHVHCTTVLADRKVIARVNVEKGWTGVSTWFLVKCVYCTVHPAVPKIGQS